jgi:hypothetical protein
VRFGPRLGRSRPTARARQSTFEISRELAAGKTTVSLFTESRFQEVNADRRTENRR